GFDAIALFTQARQELQMADNPMVIVFRGRLRDGRMKMATRANPPIGETERPRLRSPLFRKYVVLFVAVVFVALLINGSLDICVASLINGSLDIWFSYQENMSALVQVQRGQAEDAAAKVTQFVKDIEDQVGWTTQLPWSPGDLNQRRFDALRLLHQVPAITELA